MLRMEQHVLQPYSGTKQEISCVTVVKLCSGWHRCRQKEAKEAIKACMVVRYVQCWVTILVDVNLARIKFCSVILNCQTTKLNSLPTTFY